MSTDYYGRVRFAAKTEIESSAAHGIDAVRHIHSFDFVILMTAEPGRSLLRPP